MIDKSCQNLFLNQAEINIYQLCSSFYKLRLKTNKQKVLLPVLGINPTLSTRKNLLNNSISTSSSEKKKIEYYHLEPNDKQQKMICSITL
jgi:hypothetical protein